MNLGGNSGFLREKYRYGFNPLPNPSVSLPNPFMQTWYDPLSKGNTLFSAGTSLSTIGGAFKNVDLYNQGHRKGTSGNYKLEGRNAKLFKNAPMKTYTTPVSNLSKVASGLGKVSFFGGVVLDGIRVINYYQNGEGTPNSVHPTKAIVNTGMGALGLKVNPVTALLYFGVDAFYPGGWIGDENHPGAIMDQDRLIRKNQEVIPNFNLYRDVPGGL
jgi:hypothetical protein